MKDLFKGKIATVVVVLATFVLAGIAVFTAIRLFQLRQVNVAPNVPESQPHAAGINPNCAVSITLAIATPTPTATPVPQCNSACTTTSQCSTGLTCNIAAGATSGFCRNAACSSSTSCVCSTPTPTPTPTATPVPQCNSACTSDTQCSSGLTCNIATGATSGFCRNASCSTSTSCVCIASTPTPTPTPVPTITVSSCGGTCSTNNDCASNMVCYTGVCRNQSCTSSANCVCSTVAPTRPPLAAATPVPPTLPQSGTDWPTYLGGGLGVVVIIASLLIAL